MAIFYTLTESLNIHKQNKIWLQSYNAAKKEALMTLFSEPARPVGLSKALVPEELLEPWDFWRCLVGGTNAGKTYCWWTKSCTSWDAKYTMFYKVLAPSQVVSRFLVRQQYHWDSKPPVNDWIPMIHLILWGSYWAFRGRLWGVKQLGALHFKGTTYTSPTEAMGI